MTQHALAEASKMGFMFILDRKTGKPLIPTPEMKVDQTGAAGLNLWPTQPIRPSASTSPRSASSPRSGPLGAGRQPRPARLHVHAGRLHAVHGDSAR